MNPLPSTEPVAGIGGAARGRATTQEPKLAAAATINGFHQVLERAARAGVDEVDDVDIEGAVAAAVASCAEPDGGLEPTTVAEQVAGTASALTRLSLPAAAARPVDWSGFGALMPVLSASPGAGASVCAAALADTLQQSGHVLLIDAADPARSGLAEAAVYDGPLVSQAHPQVTIRYSWRGAALLARLESSLPVITPGMVPPPPMWLPPLNTPPQVTIVDIGHDGWRTVANPLMGAGGWLRHGEPVQRPVLVVRATRPSLRQAEQLLARLERWVCAGVAVLPFQLVVMAATRWPPGVVGAAGRRLEPLLDDALFVPVDPAIAVGGITADPVGDRLITALKPLLSAWGLLPAPARARFRKGSR